MASTIPSWPRTLLLVALALLFAPLAIATEGEGSASTMDDPSAGGTMGGDGGIGDGMSGDADDDVISQTGDAVQDVQDEQLRRAKILIGVIAVIGVIGAIWLWGPAIAAAASSAWTSLGTAGEVATWSVAQRAAAVELVKQLDIWVKSNVR